MSSFPGSGWDTNDAWVLPDELRMLAESGDAAVVREVISVFQSDTAKRLERIREALASGNMLQVKLEAHAVKGSAGQVGAASLSAICRRIEAESATAGREQLERLLRDAETFLSLAETALGVEVQSPLPLRPAG